MIKKKFALVALLLLFFNNISYANTVSFVDIDFLINNSTIGKSILLKLENKDKENIKFLKEREKIIKKLESEIKNKQNVLSEKELEAEINTLKNKISEFNLEKNNIVKSFASFKNKELKEVLDKFNKIIQNYMTENSIDIVLNKKNIFIGKNTSDITKKILIEIENNLN